MKLSLTRRTVLAMSGAAALTPMATSFGAWAQSDYPNQRLTFVCAFPAGSGADVLVRYFAERVAENTGQTVIVENKPGAISMIATEFVARAEPDGYTVFVHAGNSIAGNMSMFENPAVDVVEELRGVQFINQQSFMIVVREDSPHQTLEELTAFLREQGDAASFATTATHGKVMAAIYKDAENLEAVEVGYRTGPETLTDIMSGAVDYAVLDPVFSLSQAREGRFRILAVGLPQRLQAFPDIPTMAELGYETDLTGWWGVFVPAATPDDVVNQLNGIFAEILETEETAEFLGQFGGDVWIGTPEEVDETLARHVELWADYVELAEIPKM